MDLKNVRNISKYRFLQQIGEQSRSFSLSLCPFFCDKNTAANDAVNKLCGSIVSRNVANKSSKLRKSLRTTICNFSCIVYIFVESIWANAGPIFNYIPMNNEQCTEINLQ